ncbi:MAG: D-glycero-beta-D-manno-heptose-7-phosphate kinase [Candidatus Binatia bacterium]
MAEAARLTRLVRRFPGTRVLVIGDLMLDQFVWGDVSRISPEAPVPIVRVRKQEGRPGGAGNVVTNVVALGGRADACGFVGDDLAGRALSKALTSAGGGLAGVVRSRAIGTTAKTRVIAHSQQVVRFDQDPDDGALPARLTSRLRTWVSTHARRYAVIVVSDYGKGVVTPELLGDLAELRRRHGFVYVIDPKRPNFAHYRGASLIKPNLGEASVAAGIDIVGRASLDAAGAALLRRWEADAILISRGEAGMSLFKPKARAQHFPTAAQEVYDVTGAGDTVLAACSLALAGGGTFEEAARLANHAAGVAVGKVGTATVTARELVRALAPIARGA